MITIILCSLIIILISRLSRRNIKSIARQAQIASHRRSGESAIISVKNGNLKEMNLSSLADSFIKSSEKYKNREYLKYKSQQDWKSKSFQDVYDQAVKFGSGLMKLGLLPSDAHGIDFTNSLVGIYLQNSPFWVITDHACSMNSLISVPIHYSWDSKGLEQVMNHSKVSVLVTSRDKLDIIKREKLEYLKIVILVDTLDEEENTFADFKIMDFKSIEKLGEEGSKTNLPTLDHVFTICYTSGTTGNPKGVMLTHRNMIEAGKFLLNVIPERLIPGLEDSHLSFLPSSHIFERLNVHALTWCGVQIGFGSGIVTQYPEEIIEFKPSIFPTVPRLLTRVYSKITEKLEQVGLDRNTLWDKVIFSKIAEKLGGRIKFIATGAAPIDPKILNFFRAVLGCEIVEGYGQTESCGIGTCTLVGDYTSPWGSHVGPPFPGIELKLVDVPSLGYFATDKPNPRGEICISGPNIMRGYYRDEMKTRTTIRNGWLHTGDIGQILPNGTIQILDRVNNIFKLSQGEFICPEKIENCLVSKYVSLIVVCGNPQDNFCSALIVPNRESIKEWSSLHSQSHLSDKELLQNHLLKQEILTDLLNSGRDSGLYGYEIPRRIALLDQEFTVENGFLTPSLKLKRHVIIRSFGGCLS